MALLLPTKAKSKKRRTNTRVWFWVDECKYSVVVDNVKGLGWKIVDEERHEAKSNVYWIDVAAIHERFRSIQAWQTINHFPGMPNIARKNRMGQNLNRMLKMFPREYDFYPRTWVLPGDYQFVITALRWRYLDRLRKQNRTLWKPLTSRLRIWIILCTIFMTVDCPRKWICYQTRFELFAVYPLSVYF